MVGAKRLRAIDLYSGVGGWSLGLRMAGVEVVASYERWSPANVTNFKNNRHQAQTVNIRDLSLDDLPADIDLVLGSPPCTQFSYSNRGGGGDLNDGLQDIIKFLTVVRHVQPKAWAMENVPRVGRIIDQELRPGGRLHEFAELGISHRTVDMSEYGVPQRRKRCIAGNIDFELLESYRAGLRKPTLGVVVRALSSSPVIDPVYRIELPTAELHDHDYEEFLNEEEERINRAG
jgi:DNA (cytosine-5)-methyltransferase 1